MDNYAIADQFSLLSKLMDIHGENSFKAKSLASAAFAIEKFPKQLALLPKEKIFAVKGIGESAGKKIIDLVETGELQELKELIAKTPEGVLEMMNIKGLGPKKIHILWKQLNINTIDDLREACMQNKLAETKGFGTKTQEGILNSIAFKQESKGKYLYAQAESFAHALHAKLAQKFAKNKFEITGDFRRQLEIIEVLEMVTDLKKEDLKNFFDEETFDLLSESDDIIEFIATNFKIKFYLTEQIFIYNKLFETSCSAEFLTRFKNSFQWNEKEIFKNEEEIFSKHNLQFIPPYLREKATIIQTAQENKIPVVIETSDIKGLIHSHSNWSDGAYTIEEMALELIKSGYEYFVISDHSKAAYYAGGLSEQKIIEQHKYVDELNARFAPFKIFKSIECDILSDGAMDYDDEVLAGFDLVIASIHSNIDMNEEKAMKRLLGAITNPYVTILGHMTGRRLLKRNGYPVDHKTIIDACAENNVVIEINANPQRLDMQWQWVDYAIEKGVMLSVNPDAHSVEEFYNNKYGVLVAQKGGLTKEKNLSSFSRTQFEEYLTKVKKKNGIS